VARSGSPLSSARAWLLPALTTLLLAAGVLLSAVAQLRPSDAHAQDQPAGEVAPLCERIDELARDAQLRLAVDLGITLIDLQTGESCEVRPTRIFRSASLYKLVVLAEAYRQREELDFDFEETIELLPRHSLDDPPELRLEEPLELSRFEAIERMITFSDNPSAEALRELLGPGLVAQAPAWLGLEQTSLGSIFFTTPRDMGRFLSALYRGEIVSPEASAEMLDLLLRQEINDLIPVGVDDGIPIAHKTGLLERQLHDAAIVYSPAGAYVLIALTEHQEDIDAAYEAIHSLSGLIFEGYANLPAPLLVAPVPTATPTPTPSPAVVEPTPTPTPVATVVAATPTVEVDATAGSVEPRSTGRLPTLLILGAAGAASLAAVSLIMLVARQRRPDSY
jgi:beta-lactamase class A